MLPAPTFSLILHFPDPAGAVHRSQYRAKTLLHNANKRCLVNESTPAKADLVPFTGEFSGRVTSWIDSEETYCNMTGKQEYPPPENVVASWQRVDIKAYLLMAHGQPVAYGEIWDRPVELAAEIGHLIVDPAKRGRGYGTKMLNLLSMRAAHNARVSKVVLNFHEGDETVLGCYLKAGFQLVGRGRGGHGLRMELKVE